MPGKSRLQKDAPVEDNSKVSKNSKDIVKKAGRPKKEKEPSIEVSASEEEEEVEQTQSQGSVESRHASPRRLMSSSIGPAPL